MTQKLEAEILEVLRKKIYSDTPEGFFTFFTLIHNKRPLPHACEWIEKLYEARKLGKDLVVEAFRGSTKTTTMMTFVAYRIGLEPHKANLVIQVSEDMAADNTSNIADMIEYNDNWKIIFPNIVPDKEKGWSARGYEVKNTEVPYERWVRMNSERKNPTLVGLGRTSKKITGKHPDGVCLIDDLDEELNTSSAREQAKTRKLLTGTIFTILRPETWGIVKGTPWNLNDTIA